MTNEFSFFYLFFGAGWFIKLISVALLVASVWSWSIIIEKNTFFKMVMHKIKDFENQFFKKDMDIESMYLLYKDHQKAISSPLSRIFISTMTEWGKYKENNVTIHNKAFVMERLEKTIYASLEKEVEYMQDKISFLSMCISVAPFVGLFGTIWGIMNSFAAIAGEGSTNIAIIAPGIATALSTTALGLIVAIPAAVAKYYFISKSNNLEMKLYSFSTDLESIISRSIELDKKDK